VDKALGDKIPEFNRQAAADEPGIAQLSSFGLGGSRTHLETAVIALVAVVIVGGAEVLLRILNVPQYIMPKPSQILLALYTEWPFLWPHLLITLYELFVGFAIGGGDRFRDGGGHHTVSVHREDCHPVHPASRHDAHARTGAAAHPALRFRQRASHHSGRARERPNGHDQFRNWFQARRSRQDCTCTFIWSEHVSNLHQDSHPMAMPMIIVGLMVGSIFGLLTAIGAEMVGGAEGLGNRLTYYSALIRMPQFFAIILILAIIGISIYVFFYWLGKRWAGWEA